jgi:hypothetical protein
MIRSLDLLLVIFEYGLETSIALGHDQVVMFAQNLPGKRQPGKKINDR